MPDTARLVEATPATRDRYIDLLRVGSLAVVVLGHWLMAVVIFRPDGSVRVTNILTIVPSVQVVTWLLQVMPVFFLVGGFSHAVGLASVHRRGGTYADFVAARTARLLRPTAVFATVWLAGALAVELAGRETAVLRITTRTVAQPLWFIGVYLGVVALAPPMHAAHRRLGRWSPLLPLAMVAVAAAVDVARLGFGAAQVGYLNVAVVWLAIHQVGFLYADGTLARGGRRLALVMAGTGLATTVLATTVGPYPVSMVGLPGAKVSNMSPPTLALAAQATCLIGLTMLVRGPVSRWLARPRVWAGVIVANGLAMTVFLWHLSALFGVTVATRAARLSLPPPGSATWWLTRPVWIALLVVATTPLVLLFARFDRIRASAVGTDRRRPGEAGTGPARPGRGNLVAGVGVWLCVLGVLGISTVGFGGLLAGRTATLVVLPMTPLLSIALVGSGALLLRLARRT